jgi:hypothetical protein
MIEERKGSDNLDDILYLRCLETISISTLGVLCLIAINKEVVPPYIILPLLVFVSGIGASSIISIGNLASRDKIDN